MKSRPRDLWSPAFVALGLVGCVGACASPVLPPVAPPPPAGSSASPLLDTPATIVQPSDLAAMVGAWTGSLNYKDYTTGKLTTIPVKAQGTIAGDDLRRVKLHVAYPDEPSHDGDDDYTLSADGRTVGGLAVVERTALPGGAVRIVLEETGTDGNDRKPATFRHVLLSSPASLIITKLVKVTGTPDFFERNAYRLAR